jgi:Asp-tRNA(Asn)/Glu-tRNA(Gln) amidotransferase B subunit
MSREDAAKEVEKILSTIADKSKFGLVMREVMKEMKGKADASMITELIKEKLG